MRTYTLLILFAASLLLGACKTSQDTSEQLNYYKTQSLRSDSLQHALDDQASEKAALEYELRQSLHQIEQLVVTNRSLNTNYKQLLDRYDNLVNNNADLVAATAYEKGSLQGALSNSQSTLDSRNRELATAQYELYQRESEMDVMEYNYTDLQNQNYQKDQRIRELEALVAQQGSRMQDIRGQVDQALVGFQAGDLDVYEKNGQVYVSLSQDLLFPSGAKTVNAKGKQALSQLAAALNTNPDIEILVKGHTDTDGSANTNWDLSVLRATSVVKNLVAFGVTPERITAAGKGFYEPIAENNTSSGKAANRRTDIILSPKLDQLYEILGNQ